MPDWIELKGPTKTGQNGLAWTFTVRTDRPGNYFTSIAFECDSGVGYCQVTLEVVEGTPALGELVLCDSPFDCHTTFESLASLVRILGALPMRLHCLEHLGEMGELRPRTIVLHQSGLFRCDAADVERLRGLATAGTNVVVLADEFYRGTTGAANRVLTPFGLRMKQDGREEPGLTREQKGERIIAWQDRYERVPFVSGPEHLTPHPLTAGVRRLHWFRPCPVVCESGRPLVGNPADPGECFAAVAEPGGYVVALGKSLWSGLSAVGWPFDNDRFLANALVGGDSEAALG